MKKAAKRGCVISRADAQHIAELTLCDLSLASAETDKLCSYAGTGEITAEMIDKLTIKQLDTSIYSLATELLKGNRRQALLILDDLLTQKSSLLLYWRLFLRIISTSTVQKPHREQENPHNRQPMISDMQKPYLRCDKSDESRITARYGAYKKLP